MNADEYPGTDTLPDALAFVNPDRARFWISLAEYDDPPTAETLLADHDVSSATIYRMLGELEDRGLVETNYELTASGPVAHYVASTPTPKRPLPATVSERGT